MPLIRLDSSSGVDPPFWEHLLSRPEGEPSSPPTPLTWQALHHRSQGSLARTVQATLESTLPSVKD